MLTRSLPRRRFLQTMLATGALQSAPAWAQGARQSQGKVHAPSHAGASGWVLLGTQNGAGIYRARWNAVAGELGTPELAVATPRPTFLAFHPTLPAVYACNENEGDAATVSGFALDRAHAKLTPLGTQPTHGNDPTYVSVDRTGKLLFAANYGGGSLAAFPLEAQGKPGPASGTFACAGNAVCGTQGPVHDRQDASHLHCAVPSPDGGFVLACDLGNDSILIFPTHPGDAKPLGDPLRVVAQAGSGPRHLAFHPNGRWLYCIHELTCTVDVFTWSVTDGRAEAKPVDDSIVTLAPIHAQPKEAPPDPANTAAEIALTGDGRFAYTSTRGINVLAAFSIEPSSGKLELLQQIPCGGRNPRFFALDPTERWLLCGNQDSNTITLFARDSTTGQLSPHGSQTAPSPMCIVWL